ncbi:hypothetical protein Bca52824_027999 [Brassica carinata]|uniref:DUF287 domain-containing protein n=1 Tax=Brassica carinata TaxID=52824 RepID=A0A8X7VBH3_BRACI|nr:hypothetical protein Bca52824_027999 [Brassica carinata]
MTLPTGKKKRGRSSPAEDHGADDCGSSSQPTKRQRLTSNRNPKNLQPSPGSASASPTLSGSPTQQDSEETPIGPPATSEDPPPAKRQNLPRSNQQSLSRSSSKGGTPSEQGDNEEIGSHGEPPTSREPNSTEEQIRGEEMAGGAIKPQRFYFQPAEYGKPLTGADVLKKLKKMKYDGSHDRLRMAVLYFSATVIFERLRFGTPKDHFLLRIVNYLCVCHTFPWGRFTFDDSLSEIKHMNISNILKPIGSESDLLVEIFDDGLWDELELVDDGDRNDPIVNGWNKIIIHDQVKIPWEDLYKMDAKTREKEHELERICEEPKGLRMCEETKGLRVCEETEAGCE